MAMQAGRLRHRVEVQELSQPTTDDFGQPVDVWTTISTRWASVEALSGREYWQAQQVQAQTTHRVEMRWFECLTGPKMRLKWGTRILNIETVEDPDGTKEMLQLLCTEQKTG